MSFTSSYVMAGIGTFFILFWLFLYIKYRNAYGQVIDAIDKKKFMFGEGSYRNSVNISLKAIVYMETAHSFLLRADSR